MNQNFRFLNLSICLNKTLGEIWTILLLTIIRLLLIKIQFSDISVLAKLSWVIVQYLKLSNCQEASD